MRNNLALFRRPGAIWRLPLICITLFVSTVVSAAPSLGLGTAIITSTPGTKVIPLVSEGQASSIYVDRQDHWGVTRAATDLQHDIEQVTGTKSEVLSNAGQARSRLRKHVRLPDS